LTKHPQDIAKVAPPGQVAGAPEITPKMLKSGIKVLTQDWGICMDDVAGDLARDVYRAMAMAGPAKP
jgi:hypothetical protein